jgi:hypothetical protein
MVREIINALDEQKLRVALEGGDTSLLDMALKPTGMSHG